MCPLSPPAGEGSGAVHTGISGVSCVCDVDVDVGARGPTVPYAVIGAHSFFLDIPGLTVINNAAALFLESC